MNLSTIAACSGTSATGDRLRQTAHSRRTRADRETARGALRPPDQTHLWRHANPAHRENTDRRRLAPTSRNGPKRRRNRARMRLLRSQCLQPRLPCDDECDADAIPRQCWRPPVKLGHRGCAPPRESSMPASARHCWISARILSSNRIAVTRCLNFASTSRATGLFRRTHRGFEPFSAEFAYPTTQGPSSPTRIEPIFEGSSEYNSLKTEMRVGILCSSPSPPPSSSSGSLQFPYSEPDIRNSALRENNCKGAQNKCELRVGELGAPSSPCRTESEISGKGAQLESQG